MSTQADVGSIQALKDLRAVLALYAEEASGSLGAAKMEAKRTVYWLHHDRKIYWVEQVKRRREWVTSARAEVMRRKMAKTPEHTPSFLEQKEILRRAEAALQEAETKLILIKKWEPALQQAVLELYAGLRRISDLVATDIPRSAAILERMVDALEAYVRVELPSGTGIVQTSQSSFTEIAETILNEAEAEAECARPEPVPESEPPVPDLFD